MVSLKLQKRLAASVLKCGRGKVWLDPNETNEISMANSRQNIRKVGRCKTRGSHHKPVPWSKITRAGEWTQGAPPWDIRRQTFTQPYLRHQTTTCSSSLRLIEPQTPTLPPNPTLLTTNTISLYSSSRMGL